MNVKTKVYKISPKSNKETLFETDGFEVKQQTFEISPLDNNDNQLLYVHTTKLKLEEEVNLPIPAYISLDEVVKLFYWNKETILNLHEKGVLEAIKVKGKWFIHEPTFNQFLQELKVK